MFTKEDFASFFTDLQMLEENMRTKYEVLESMIEDPYVKNKFRQLKDAEANHKKLVSEARQIILKAIEEEVLK
jgi:hypothetical protein